MMEATLYEKLPHEKVKYNLCAHRCVIQNSKKGICRVRENTGGKLYTLNVYHSNPELHELGNAAAHLIHGSTEGRFRITYVPEKLTRDEITSVGFDYMDLKTAIKTYKPYTLKDGLNIVKGEEIYFIPSPGLGLWTAKEKFINSLKTKLRFAEQMIAREPKEPLWQQLEELDTEDISKYEV